MMDSVGVVGSMNLWIPPEDVNVLLLKLEDEAVVIVGDGIPEAGAVVVADKPPKWFAPLPEVKKLPHVPTSEKSCV